MKKNILRHIVVVALLGFVQISQAQNIFKFPENHSNAYIDYLYDAKDVKVITEVYEKNVPKVSFPTNVNNVKESVLLDIYYGENATVNIGLKPLIIFAPGGGREKSDYKFIASDLARRGFVTASINVRGSTVNNLQLMFNSKNINPVLVMTAAMDLHNAINYILSQRATTLNVDPNYVIVAGGSLGGAVSLQAAFMDKEEAKKKFGKNVNNSFFNSYDPKLQTNNIKGVLDFYGAVYDVNFIKPTETKPVFIFHGSKDPAVPYMEGNLFYNPIDVYVYGGVRIVEKIKNQNSFYFVTGKEVGHTLTPQCNYDAAKFPNGYPMNWYPDMLFFIKNAILGNQTIKVYKTIDCIEPECSLNKNSCRVVVDDVNSASRKPSNAVIPQPNFDKSIISKPISTNNTTGTTTSENVVKNPTEKLDHCKAFSFDGNDFIKINNSPSVTVGFDVEFWFKQTNTNPDNNIEILYSIGTSNNIRNSAFTFGLLGNNQIYIGYFNGNTYIEKTQNITAGQNKTYSIDNNWHHYHIKVSNGNITGEIDGNKGVFNLPNSIITSVNTDNNSNTYFGGADFNKGIVSYKYNNAIGQMHEIRLWKSGYSFDYSSESILPAAAGLVAYWKLNSNEQIVKDEAFYKVNGTLGSNNNVEKSDPVFVNNCDGSVIPAIVTSAKDTTLSIVKDGFSIKNGQRQTIEFNITKNKQAILTVLNSNKEIVLTQVIQLSAGSNLLDSYLKNLEIGNYTLRMSYDDEVYLQQLVISK